MTIVLCKLNIGALMNMSIIIFYVITINLLEYANYNLQL
jgi:hypothetical protein